MAKVKQVKEKLKKLVHHSDPADVSVKPKREKIEPKSKYEDHPKFSKFKKGPINDQ